MSVHRKILALQVVVIEIPLGASLVINVVE